MASSFADVVCLALMADFESLLFEIYHACIYTWAQEALMLGQL